MKTYPRMRMSSEPVQRQPWMTVGASVTVNGEHGVITSITNKPYSSTVDNIDVKLERCPWPLPIRPDTVLNAKPTNDERD